MPAVGQVCEVYFYEDAPKKYAICVDLEDRLFLLMSRECYNETTDIPVDEHEIECLTCDSYVGTHEPYYIFDDDIRAWDGFIPDSLREEICAAIERHGVMPPIHMNPILQNLRGIDGEGA